MVRGGQVTTEWKHPILGMLPGALLELEVISNVLEVGFLILGSLELGQLGPF